MSDWIRVAAVHECPPGCSLETVAQQHLVALYNVDGDFFALDGVCPHQGGPLGKGTLDGCIVTCPWHGWQFDVRTGSHQINPSLRHSGFAVKVEGNEVFVALDPQSE